MSATTPTMTTLAFASCTARAMIRAVATSTQRALAATKFRPIELAPSATHARASSADRTPQIFTCTMHANRSTRADSALDAEELFDLRDDLRRLDGLRDVGVRTEGE